MILLVTRGRRCLGVALPSGNGAHASDFESWLELVEDPPIVTAIEFFRDDRLHLPR
jgi:hypothetical protein